MCINNKCKMRYNKEVVIFMKRKSMAIILSAGIGKRMNSDVPKQYIKINNREILYYTIKAFEESDIDEIILVAGKDDIEYCKENIVDKYSFKKVSKVVSGGSERYNSVYNGLKEIDDCDIVLIHDGARPCIKNNEINDIIKCVEENDACIMAVNAKDTIKIVKDGFIIDSPNRDAMWQAQTPQGFRFEKIKKSYEKLIEEKLYMKLNITDDANVWSIFNEEKVKIYTGNYQNIKVTTPEDLEMVKNHL